LTWNAGRTLTPAGEQFKRWMQDQALSENQLMTPVPIAYAPLKLL